MLCMPFFFTKRNYISISISLYIYIYTCTYISKTISKVKTHLPLFFVYMTCFLLPQWMVMLHRKTVSHVHVKSSVTTNKGSAGCVQAVQGKLRVNQWLTSRRLQYPNLLLPSSPVSMKEKVSLC